MFLTLLLFSFSGELRVCLLRLFFARTTSLPIVAANHDTKALGGGLLIGMQVQIGVPRFCCFVLVLRAHYQSANHCC